MPNKPNNKDLFVFQQNPNAHSWLKNLVESTKEDDDVVVVTEAFVDPPELEIVLIEYEDQNGDSYYQVATHRQKANPEEVYVAYGGRNQAAASQTWFDAIHKALH